MRRSTELLLIRDRNVSVASLNVIQTLKFLFLKSYNKKFRKLVFTVRLIVV